MTTLVSIKPSPLMEPVQYNGQTYFTGQYFHQLYRANSDADGKYKQVAHFLRLIRSIEAYPLYVESGDIAELTWEKVKADLTDPNSGSVSVFSDPDTGSLKALFHASRYQPIMLINKAAQVALTHHLDDEVSKQVSVAVNRHAARSGDPLALKYKQAKTIASCSMSIFKLFGADEPMARVLSAEKVKEEVGIDFSKVLASNSVDEAPMTSTDLGKAWGLTSKIGEKMNAALHKQGYAEKNEHGDWVPTEKGKPYCTCNPYKSPNSSHTGYRTLWYRRVLDVLVKEDAA